MDRSRSLLAHVLDGHLALGVEMQRESGALRLSVTVRCSGRTGVEMEALTGVCVGLLALYDMIKAVEREARIEGIELVRKSGGKSGDWLRPTGKD